MKEICKAGEARSYASKDLADSRVGANIISYSYDLEETGTRRSLSATESMSGSTKALPKIQIKKGCKAWPSSPGDPSHFILVWFNGSPPTGLLLSDDLQNFIPVETQMGGVVREIVMQAQGITNSVAPAACRRV